MKNKAKTKAASPKSSRKSAGKSIRKVAKRAKPTKLAVSRKMPARSKVAAALKKIVGKAASKKMPSSKSVAHKINRTLTSAGKKLARAKAAIGDLTGLGAENQIRRMSLADYMNDMQLDFFRRRLHQMREEVVAREVDVKERLHQREVFADPADRASAEEEHWLDLRLRERESLLLRKIEEAMRRIKDKEYGYCEVTGEPIGIPRLLARPTATVCVDVKGHNEQLESQFRDR